jgi:AraC-like DNA-binding protein
LLGSHFGDQLKKTRASTLTNDELDKLQTTLEPYMAEQRPFLQFNLTLSELAAKIGFKERQLSEYINTYCYTTFQDYINSYRIEEAKRLIGQSKNSRKTMLEIAYESGFNSKSAFNFAFKKHTHTTPTQYKKTFKTIRG